MESIKGTTIFWIVIIFQTSVSAQQGNGKFCREAEPLCGSSLFSYPNTYGYNLAESGPDYGSLLLPINPSWFYFQIDQPGDIQLKIEQSTTIGGFPDLDVDYILYGPFEDPHSPCTSNLIRSTIADYSFEADVVEHVNLANTKSGEYYLLLITNFSLDSGFITVAQTAGAATTNCTLVEVPIVRNPKICPGDILNLNAATEEAVKYNWYEDDSFGNFVPISNNHSQILNVSTPNIYRAEAINVANVVVEIYEFNVGFLNNFPLPITAKVISRAFIEENDIEVRVNATSDDFLYAIDNGPWQEESIFENVSLGSHDISVINSSGCRTGYAKITVMDYPHYFTPNNDGFNDYWNIPGLENQNNAQILIYDRYGKLIKQLSPNSIGWDGTFNGQKMPSSDYWFTVRYTEPKDGTLHNFNAHFTLKR